MSQNLYKVKQNVEINRLMLNHLTKFFVIIFYSPSKDEQFISKLEDLSELYEDHIFIFVNYDENVDSVNVYQPLNGISVVFSDCNKTIFGKDFIKSIPLFVSCLESNFELFQNYFLTKKEVLFKELDRLFKEEFTGIHLFIKGSPDDMQCKFTREFMKVLEPYQFDYTYLDILQNEDLRNWNRLYSGWKTYPQLWINGKFIGGLDTVKQLIQNNEFQSLLPPSNENLSLKKERLLKKWPILLVVPDSSISEQEQFLNQNGAQFSKFIDSDHIFETHGLYIEKELVQIPKIPEALWEMYPLSSLKLSPSQKLSYFSIKFTTLCFVTGNLHEGEVSVFIQNKEILQELDMNKVLLFNILADQDLKNYIESISHTSIYPQFFKKSKYLGHTLQ